MNELFILHPVGQVNQRDLAPGAWGQVQSSARPSMEQDMCHREAQLIEETGTKRVLCDAIGQKWL